MVQPIGTGFPLRRCSWAFAPIVPDVIGRQMIRWLDLVCLRQPALKLKSLLDPSRAQEPKRAP